MITMETMKLGVKILTGSMDYQVPHQDLTIPINRFPTLPKSRFVIRNVKKKNPEKNAEL
jgi:fatty-acid peroxygenase